MNDSLNKVQKLVDEALKLLNPYLNFKSTIKLYHNFIEVQDRKLILEGNIHIFGLGKAASFEVEALKRLFIENGLEDRIIQYVAYTKDNHTLDDEKIFQLEGSHPILSEKNIIQTKKFIKKLESIPATDTLIFLLSGGGSALLELPVDNLSFQQLKEKHEQLLRSGQNINFINKERKALSRVKNGGLIDFIKAEHIIQLITCDIPNEELADVSSGPLLKSQTDIKHPLTFKTQSASRFLQNLAIEFKANIDKIYDCSIDELLESTIDKLPQKGEMIISGGEAPITIPKDAGRGGRNTHFVLALANKIYKDEKNKDICILSIGTDGGDGPTDAAGAYINYSLFKSLEAKKYLTTFDSYSYFAKIESLIKTGPTQTNVMDLRCIWRE